ncbi:EMSY N-terminal [Macleaya cordata]|uniref:EMSY N-terminal n=1 Tax=Macleaya cordata TaxID=56857 RepID=A0A200Q4M3_MACCD|nr:EMSY N-terminal [Macleaya cordata]
MKFKQGNKVEVLRRTKEQFASWYPGKIISADGSQYSVSYDLFMNPKGEPVVENVCRENVRSKPPPVKREEGWVIGDIAEVFDLYCWKVGKVAKVLNNNRIVIRLCGSIQLKEFHESNLRVRQAWHNNKWVAVPKDGGDRQNDNNGILNSSRFSQGLVRRSPQQVIHKETCLRDREDEEQFKTSHPMRTSKRNLESHLESALDDGVMEIRGSKRKACMKVGKGDQLPMRTLSSLKRVSAVSSPKAKVGKKCMIGYSKMDDEAEKTKNYNLHPFSMAARTPEESTECSVASCSSNYLPGYTASNSQKSSKNVDDCSFDDAGSFCPSISEKKYLPSCAEDELEADIHKLELHAYKSTVQALYASGPLSWEQESLLTNLRLSLNISNEEHLLQLRQLLSAQVL